MNALINAALTGPELKKAKVKHPKSGKEHEFNIKAVSYHIDGPQLMVRGQLSHCLAGRPDDQLWYAFAKTATQVLPNDAAKMIVRREDGGISKIVGEIADLADRAKTFLPGYAAKLITFLNENNSLLHGDSGWERAAESLIGAIAAQASKPSAAGISALELFEHDGFRGKRADVLKGKDVADIKRIQMNDNISSLRVLVPKGTTLQLFEHSNFGGKSFDIGAGLCIIGYLKGALNNKLPNLVLHSLIVFVDASSYGGSIDYRMDSGKVRSHRQRP